MVFSNQNLLRSFFIYVWVEIIYKSGEIGYEIIQILQKRRQFWFVRVTADGGRMIRECILHRDVSLNIIKWLTVPHSVFYRNSTPILIFVWPTIDQLKHLFKRQTLYLYSYPCWRKGHRGSFRMIKRWTHYKTNDHLVKLLWPCWPDMVETEIENKKKFRRQPNWPYSQRYHILEVEIIIYM